MGNKLRSIILTFAASSFVAVPAIALSSSTAFAATTNIIQNGVCSGTNFDLSGTGSTDCSSNANTNSFNSLLTKIINIFSAVVGVIAVIMIIVGGLRYITSGGDAGNVSTAKNTIIYALVGLVIVALAQLIVHFVLTQSQNLGQ